MSYRVSTSALVAGELTHIFTPRNPRPTSKYPFLICHSAGSPDDGVGVSLPHFTQLAAVLARGSAQSAGQGMPGIAGYMTGKFPFGNDTAVSRIEAMRTQIGTSSGADSSKFHGIAVSMGMSALLRYAAANPTKVASITGVIPLTSLVNFYAQNPGGSLTVAGVNAMSVAASWGLSYATVTATLTSGSTAVTLTAGTMTAGQNGYLVVSNTGARGAFNNPVPIGATATFVDSTHLTLSAPATFTGSKTLALAQPLPTTTPNADLVALAPAIAAAGIPTRLYYSTVDQYVDPADTQALATACGGTATAIDSTFGHVDGTIGEFATFNGGTNYSDLVSKLVAAGA